MIVECQADNPVCGRSPELDSKPNLFHWTGVQAGVGRGQPVLARTILGSCFHQHSSQFSTIFSNFLLSPCYPPCYPQAAACEIMSAPSIWAENEPWKITPQDRNELLTTWQEQPDLALLLRETDVIMLS